MKKYIYIYTVLIVCMLCSTALIAQTQNITITGTVFNKASKVEIPDVTVLMEKPYKVLGLTDIQGQFEIKAPANATIVFTCVGFAKTTIKLQGGQKNVTVYMTEDVTTLKDVVIVAYQKRVKETTTGSITVIPGKDIQDVPVSNVEQLLQGKVPGLNIQNNTGAPGFRGSVQVRGLSTLSVTGSGDASFLQPTSPLYIIDGVPIDADKASDYGFQTQGPGISPLSLIPQEDIESIQVLKDAQATSMYGSRGAYGVIIISTKRGNSKVPRVRYTTNFFVNATPKLRGTLGGNAERQLKIQQIEKNAPANDPAHDPNHNDILNIGNSTFLADSLNAYWNNSTDWQAVFYRTTYNQTHNLAFDGGDQKFNYKTNLGYYSEKGVIQNTGFDRYNMNMNMEFKPNDKFRFFGSVFGSLGTQGKGNGLGLLQQGVAANGQASTLLPPPSYYQASSGVVSALKTTDNNNSRNLRANIDTRYELIPGLAIASSISYDNTSETESTFTPAAANAQFAKVYDYVSKNYTLYNRNSLTYSKALGTNHNIFFNAFNEIYKKGTQSRVTIQQRTPNDQIQGPIGYDAYNSRGGGILSNYVNATIASFAASFSYDFQKKFVAEFSYRLDGTSSNGLENLYSKNPSIGLRWNLSKEKWLEKVSWLTYSALKLTWGQNIVPTGNLQSIYGLYNLNGNFNDNPTIGINYDQVPNPFLKPTTTTQYNFGVEAGFLKDRFEMTFDTYFKKVDNLLFDRYLPNTTGFNRISSNDAGIANYGYELMLTARIISSKSVTWSITVNGAINHDVLLKLPAENNGQYVHYDYSGYNQHTVFRVGQNTLSNYLMVNQGVYATDADVPVSPITGKKYQTNGIPFKGGDPIFKDVNGDYILDGRDYQISGNSQPIGTGGFSTYVSYKNFGLNIFGSFTAKRTILNNALSDRMSITRDPFSLNAVGPLNDLDIWKKQGDIAKYPNPYDYSRYSAINPLRPDQTLWAEDGSYLKISNVTLSYMFNKSLIKKAGFNSLRVYFSTDNLVTFSKYSGPNPENVTSLGRDISSGYPVPRRYNLGLNVELNTGN